MILVIECVILCIVFTLIILPVQYKDPMVMIMSDLCCMTAISASVQRRNSSLYLVISTLRLVGELFTEKKTASTATSMFLSRVSTGRATGVTAQATPMTSVRLTIVL